MRKLMAQRAEATCPKTSYEVLGECSGLPHRNPGPLQNLCPCSNNTCISSKLHETPDDNLHL